MGNAFLFLRYAMFAVMVLKFAAVAAEGFLQISVPVAVALALEKIKLKQAALSIQQLAIALPHIELRGGRWWRSGGWSPP